MSGLIIASALSVLFLGSVGEKETSSIAESFDNTLETYLVRSYGIIGAHNIQKLVSYKINDSANSKLEINNVSINLPKLNIMAGNISVHNLEISNDADGTAYPSALQLDINGIVVGGMSNAMAKSSFKVKTNKKIIEIEGELKLASGLELNIVANIVGSEKSIADAWSWLFYAIRKGEYSDTRWIKSVLSVEGGTLSMSIGKLNSDENVVVKVDNNNLTVNGSVEGVGSIDFKINNLMVGSGAYSIMNKDGLVTKMVVSIEHSPYLNKLLNDWGREEFVGSIDRKVDTKLLEEGYTDPGYFSTTRGTLDIWTSLYVGALANKGRIFVGGEVVNLDCGKAIMKNLLINSRTTNALGKGNESCNRKWDQVIGMIKEQDAKIQVGENNKTGINLDEGKIRKEYLHKDVGGTKIGEWLSKWNISNAKKIEFILDPRKARLTLKDSFGAVSIKDIFNGSETTNLYLNYKK